VSDVLVAKLIGCARCDQDHVNLPFKQLKKPVVTYGDTYTHWCSCPVNGEPILLTTTAEEHEEVVENGKACSNR
jgi:hypothetical protein